MAQPIPFSPPDITQAEIDKVTQVLRSGWLTTGPLTKAFEGQLAACCGTGRAVCLNSATAAMELTLLLLGIGPGDEVITTPYTYTATAAVILHVGATPVFVDIEEEGLEMDLRLVEAAITPRTKAILPVDVGGRLCDYPALLALVESHRPHFLPANELQQAIGRIAVIADAAHSFGGRLGGIPSGGWADFSCFSFHAVKNLTTGEGGAVTWRPIPGVEDGEIYRRFQLLSLHGQDKDALAKATGGWEYDILLPGYKCNMTDVMAALGVVQLERYPALEARRRELVAVYDGALAGSAITHLVHFGPGFASSAHLYMAFLPTPDPERRGRIITALTAAGIHTNVHYKPLPAMTAYQRLGWRMEDYPNAWNRYCREITLPLHTLLSDDDARRVAENLLALL